MLKLYFLDVVKITLENFVRMIIYVDRMFIFVRIMEFVEL